uniref:Uncharacterized protein n=1 Tax=Rangifer tarandus platyrhynchus TaxID=3082113 RepID=A0ACB0F036_RANTA|nr:unnamed protein product [Rangifer tarandus platyrhynchus]
MPDNPGAKQLTLPKNRTLGTALMALTFLPGRKGTILLPQPHLERLLTRGTSLGLKPSPGTARCAQERGRAQRLAGQGRPRSPRVTEAFPPVSLPGTTLRSSHSFMSAIREVPAPKAIPGHREPPPPDPRVRSLDAPPHSPRHILCEAPSRDGMHCSAMVCVLSNLSQWTVSSAGRVQGYMETQDILKNTGQ